MNTTQYIPYIILWQV